MENHFEIQIEVTEEAGYNSAMLGISFNKDQKPENMPPVAGKLAPLDFGHNKFLEQIMVWIVVRAPRYWWQEADTFRLSSKSSQSTMHTILRNKLEVTNFECEDVDGINMEYLNRLLSQKELVNLKRKLPEGFMQKRMWMMSYKTLRNIIIQRRHHRLPQWSAFISAVLSQVRNPELLPSLNEEACPASREIVQKDNAEGMQTLDNWSVAVGQGSDNSLKAEIAATVESLQRSYAMRESPEVLDCISKLRQLSAVA